MALFEWHPLESSILRWAWVQIISPERLLVRCAPSQECHYVRQFLTSAFSEMLTPLSSSVAGTFLAGSAYLLLKAVPPIKCALPAPKREKEHTMGGELIGLVAVILGMGVPLGALYTYYRVRKLRSEERLAAIAPRVVLPIEPEMNPAARSRRAGVLMVR